MERKGQHLMPAGNAIERVHKNIQEMKNFMRTMVVLGAGLLVAVLASGVAFAGYGHP